MKISQCILVLGIVLIGCAKKNKDDISKIQNYKKNDFGVQFVIEGTDRPHEYQVILIWPAKYKNIKIENDGAKVFETSSERQFTMILKDDSEYDFKVTSLDKDTPILVGEFSGKTAKDLVVKKLFELDKNLTLNSDRVFFDSAQIITNGFNFKIQAVTLLSKNAEIMSFRPHAKAKLESNGRSGGLVEIRVKKTAGNLKISMRGENGGDGNDGAPFPTRAADGLIGYPPSIRPNILCTRDIYEPANGRNGLKGNPGSPAGKGGNSGTLVFEVAEFGGGGVQVEQEAGLAGFPGRGGDGQEGGLGVPYHIPTNCPEGKKGNDGHRGPQGFDGLKAADGIVEQKCVAIGQGPGKC